MCIVVVVGDVIGDVDVDYGHCGTSVWDAAADVDVVMLDFVATPIDGSDDCDKRNVPCYSCVADGSYNSLGSAMTLTRLGLKYDVADADCVDACAGCVYCVVADAAVVAAELMLC